MKSTWFKVYYYKNMIEYCLCCLEKRKKGNESLDLELESKLIKYNACDGIIQEKMSLANFLNDSMELQAMSKLL